MERRIALHLLVHVRHIAQLPPGGGATRNEECVPGREWEPASLLFMLFLVCGSGVAFSPSPAFSAWRWLSDALDASTFWIGESTER